MKKTLQQTPLFLFLIPFFFVLHGYSENFGYINITDCLLLILTYAGSAAFIYFIFLPFYKSNVKAALMASFLMAFYCFFGAIHDFLKSNIYLLGKFSVLLPLFVIIAIVLFIFLKKTKQDLFKPVLFINVLVLAYVVFDGVKIIGKSMHPLPNKLSVYSFAKDNPYDSCASCPKPDIYFLLFDEYASTISLKQKYNYDDSDLDIFLKQHGFNIQANSSSNYNLTPFSMSSILNMSYLSGIRDPLECTKEDYAYCNDLIRNNEVIKFLSFQGYDIVNYSVFDLAGNPSRVDQNFLPLKTKLISDRAMFTQMQQELDRLLYSKNIELDWFAEHTLFKHLNNNNKFIDLTERTSAATSAKPRFVYMHVYMPHPPYFFDKNGKRRDEATVYKENKETFLQAYLNYLPYVNSRVKEVVSSIQQNTNGNAVIVFMGDHGFRYPTTETHPANYFQNQNAIYFPDRDYHLLKDSVSGVNQFRIIFNKLFNQRIPLLQDSTIYLKDKH